MARCARLQECVHGPAQSHGKVVGDTWEGGQEAGQPLVTCVKAGSFRTEASPQYSGGEDGCRADRVLRCRICHSEAFD